MGEREEKRNRGKGEREGKDEGEVIINVYKIYMVG